MLMSLRVEYWATDLPM